VTSPVNSILHMYAYTSNAPANVHLDAAYEGDVELQSGSARHADVQNVNRADPSGQGRTRIISWLSSLGRKTARGSIQWSQSSTSPLTSAPGSVSIVTNDQIHLWI
jgi:hypothetical protein